MTEGNSPPPPDQEITEGDWAGWTLGHMDPYEENVGPFYRRLDERGARRSAFRVETRHLNNSGFVHGGCLMTFADFSLFWIAHEFTRTGPAVTASFTSDFISAAQQHDVLQCGGEVIRAAASLIFLRGIITNVDKPVLSFSAIIKRIRLS